MAQQTDGPLSFHSRLSENRSYSHIGKNHCSGMEWAPALNLEAINARALEYIRFTQTDRQTQMKLYTRQAHLSTLLFYYSNFTFQEINYLGHQTLPLRESFHGIAIYELTA